MSWEETGLRARKLLTILDPTDSQHNWRHLYDHLTTWRVWTLTMKRIFVRAPKITRKELRKSQEKWLRTLFELLNHLTVISCVTSYKKWVQRERRLFKTHLPYAICLYGFWGRVTDWVCHLYNQLSLIVCSEVGGIMGMKLGKRRPHHLLNFCVLGTTYSLRILGLWN